MLACLAIALEVGLAELPSLALQVESEARALTVQSEITPALMSQIEAFSADAERLSVSLQKADVEQDLPSIFHGIAEDARERMSELAAADTATERTMAFDDLRALLSDAILIAPMAAAAAEDRAMQSQSDAAARN